MTHVDHIAKFDAGFVRLKDGRYVPSDHVALNDIAPGLRGVVQMRNLGLNGRFANQLLQWAFLNFYAWRHDLRIEAPYFPAAAAIRAKPESVHRKLPTLIYGPFEDAAALALWSTPQPPADIDFDGYFQELPRCWAPHRALLRKLLDFGRAANDAAAAWRTNIAPSSTKLIAIHIRRGDLADAVHASIPQFKPVPIDWYVDWVTAQMAAYPKARLNVASDSPDLVRPAFAQFDPLPPAIMGLPGALDDLLAMRAADIFAFGNSSFGRLAALLADDMQQQAVADIHAGRLIAQPAWEDRAFWAHFGPCLDVASDDLHRRLQKVSKSRGWWRRLLPRAR